jgi:phosphate transport system protein
MANQHKPGDLAALDLRWSRMLRLAESALSHATAALLEGDADAVQWRSSFDDLLLALEDELDAHAATIQAWSERRVPAPDLRRIVIGAQVSLDAECLGELARTLADLARSRPATATWPAQLVETLREMAQDCLTMIATVAAGVDSVDTTTPPPLRALQRTRNAVGLSHALLYRRLAALGETVDVRTGVDLCLVAHSLLRCVEHTVSIARQLALLRNATEQGS